MANELFITHTYTNKNKEEIATTYRIDAEFVPTEQSQICIEFIKNYCISKGKKDAKWLYELMTSQKAKDSEGVKTRKITNLEIRKAFVEKYFPALIEKKTSHKTQNILEELQNFLNS